MSLDNIGAISQHQAGCRASTQAVRAGIDRDTAFGAVTPPLVLSSNFSFAGFDEKRQYDYSRSGNPTRDLLGEALAQLEGGAGGVVTSTGMSAITLVLISQANPAPQMVLILMAIYVGISIVISVVANVVNRRLQLVER